MSQLLIVRGCGFAGEWSPRCFPEKREGSSPFRAGAAVISPGNWVAVSRDFPEGLAHPVCFISSL